MTDSPATTGAHGHGDEHAVGHIVPLRVLIATGIGLLLLTWLTVTISRIHLGEFNIFAALGIAVIKGSLVALFFMHLRWDRPFNAIVFVGALAFVALFMSLAMTDSAEYQADTIPGDSPDVVQAIQSNG